MAVARTMASKPVLKKPKAEGLAKAQSADKLKAQILSKRVMEPLPVEFLSTGSTNLNLAASQHGRDGGFARGRIINIVGDGSAGKTIVALEFAHWCYRNIMNTKTTLFSPVEKLTIVYNNAESVMDFPLAKMYGKDFVKGVEWVNSSTVQHMGRDLTRRLVALEDGQCLLYIQDSWDALDSEEGETRFFKSAEQDKAIDGSFNVEKQKYGSQQFFKNMCSLMDGKDATFVVISQTRVKIGVTFGESKYRGGGAALDFYTHQVVWLAVKKKMFAVRLGESRVYGVRIKAKFKRNKTALPFREAEFVVLLDYGIDDIGSMLDYLYGLTPAGDSKGAKMKELEFQDEKFTRAGLIDHIEVNNLEDKLSYLCEDKFLAVEAEFITKRKSKFKK